jgi:tRNA A-37 threonylcarbamoyl transferase component Bud32
MNHITINILISCIIIVLSIYIYCNTPKTNEYYGIVNDCKTNVDHLLDDYIYCDWEMGNLLGSGKKGDVYKASCDLYPSHSFAIKEQKNSSRNKILNEANNQRLAGYQNTPEVYDAFMCGDNGYIITDVVDYDLTDYIKRSSDNPIARNNLINNLQSQAITKFLQAASNGIVHDDTHVENMRINEDENGNPILYFIDWGYSEKQTLTDEEVQKKIVDLEKTFNLLRFNLTMPTSSYKTPAAPSKNKKSYKREFDSEPIYKTTYLAQESPNKKTNSPTNYALFTTPVKDNKFSLNLTEDEDAAFSTPTKNNLLADFEEIKQEEDNESEYSTPKKNNKFF